MVFGGTGGSWGAVWVVGWGTKMPYMLWAQGPMPPAPRHTAQNIAFREVGRQAIMADLDWCGVRYLSEGKNPDRGLAVARMTAHITYLSEPALHRKFGRRLQDRKDRKSTRLNSSH